MQRPKFKLDADDASIQKTAMLTDKHIQMAQELLHQQFPHFEGLLSPSIGTAKQLQWWENTLSRYLYDRLFSGMSLFTKEQIAALLFVEDKDDIEVTIPPVQQQSNGTDCGVFAIAFATALCYQLNPASLKFNRQVIRAHLWDSIQNGYLGIFPFEEASSKEVDRSLTIQVYCDWHLPYNPNKNRMAECSECKQWFHKKCQQIPDKVFKFERFKWQCKDCKNV